MTSTKTELLPLESGDRLTREEFHRRYSARPDIRKAELVQGVVYVMSSPVNHRFHGKPHAMVIGWLCEYLSRTAGVEISDNATVYLSDEDEVQPDACLFRLGMPARETADGYIEGAPELVVEIAASSASYDLHDKMESYRRAGVQEYIVWRTYDEAIDWFRLREGRYERVPPNAAGVIESAVFPGLRLHVASMLAFDRAGVRAALAPEA